MTIPKNIIKEDLLQAIKKIDAEGIPADADSQYYDVVFNGKNYPPKVVVSFANIFANGFELDRKSFSGGLKTQCFKLLKKNGFEIKKKKLMSYYNELIKFLTQATTDDLGTTRNNYLQEYLGLDIKISFGQGGIAKIPWISFLAENQTTSNGIYPVYLYFKSENLLVLAYGVSVTNVPNKEWSLKNPKTISSYFDENGLGAPYNYGNSFIFKTYNTKQLPGESIIDMDLNEILNYYKSINFSNNKQLTIEPQGFKMAIFQETTGKAGLIFSPQLIQRFIASLWTKPFVICSGLSGSGKTKLAQAFVQWISESDQQYKIIPVGADWTNREPLLGYPNGLDPKSYVTPDSSALQLILEASKEENQNKPYFMILDEMNLSHVERYFADFLSIMESKEKLKLYSGEKRYTQYTKENEFDDEYFIPYEISWPKNLFIIGTVNIDETTYMFSPKVLDRANVIEFRITPDEMGEFIKEIKELKMDELFLDKDKGKGGAGQSMGENFLKSAKDKTISKIKEIEGDDNVLNKFFGELQIVGAEFGYRSASEILLLITKLGINGFVDDEGKPINNNTKIDIAIMQKLLPKLHGSRKKLVGPLETLAGFCVVRINESQPEEQHKTKNIYQQYISENRDRKKWKTEYPISFEKIERMHKNVIENGFTSYAEA
jgi:5-methylcytosine-specific restriction enzyme B